MCARAALRLIVLALALLSVPSVRIVAQQAVPHPDQYFGFKIGSDGELARYPKILEYFQLVAMQTDRVKYEELGQTFHGPSTAVPAAQMGRTTTAGTND